MKRIARILGITIIAAVIAIGFTGCIDPDNGDISVTFIHITANGSALEITTRLSLTFDKDIEGLSAADITLMPGSTGAVKGDLTRTGTGVYELSLSDIGANGTITVSVSKAGYDIIGGSRTVTVYYYGSSGENDIIAEFTGLTADGSTLANTTKLTLTFDKDIDGLSATDITLNAGSTGAVKGMLSRTGTGTYELSLSGIGANGTITVSVSKAGYAITGGSKTVTIYLSTDITVEFTGLTQNGSNTVTTTKLTLTFDKDIEDLTEADITINSESTGAVKGVLTRTGTGVYELTVTDITRSGLIFVNVVKSGYAITNWSRWVNIYWLADIAVEFTELSANGSETATTTTLSLHFDNYIDGLTVEDITFDAGSTGAVISNFESLGYQANIYLIGITSTGTVTVSVEKSGYDISGGSKTVTIYQYTQPAVVLFNGLSQDGSDMFTTTALTLSFNMNIDDLSLEEINLDAGSTGAEKGYLINRGSGVYELGLEGVAASGMVSVSVSKESYVINGGPRSVYIYHVTPALFKELEADGSSTALTTKLTLTFDKDITGLSSADISLINTQAQKGSLHSLGDGVYELEIHGITATGIISVWVNKTGYNITDYLKDITIYFYKLITFTELTADGSATAVTTRLTIIFDNDLEILFTEDILFDAGTTGAVKGILGKTGPGNYYLTVSGITAAGTVTVTVPHKAGYDFSPNAKSVMVYPEPGTYFTYVDFYGPTEKVISIGRTITNNLSISNDGSITLNITESFDKYEWYVGGTKVADGNNVTLQADNPAFKAGANWITAVIYTGTGANAIPWSGEIMVVVNN